MDEADSDQFRKKVMEGLNLETKGLQGSDVELLRNDLKAAKLIKFNKANAARTAEYAGLYVFRGKKIYFVDVHVPIQAHTYVIMDTFAMYAHVLCQVEFQSIYVKQ